MAVAKKKGGAKALTPEQAKLKIQQDHRALIRGIFRKSGFRRITGVSDKEFNYNGQKSDFDDYFIYENVVIFVEYTAASAVGDHLKPKSIIYGKIAANPNAFIEFLKGTFPDSADQFDTGYHESKTVARILYCSRHNLEAHYKANVPEAAYLDYPAARYFASVVDAIKKSAQPELLQFIGIDTDKVGKGGKFAVSKSGEEYPGSLLPEAHSGFADGYKVVSFYVDPEALLRTSYVLRKDGWQDSLSLYQRMISKAKVESIRDYLRREKRVFINNIIVTLPSDVHPVDTTGKTVDAKTLTATSPVIIKLPVRPNSIGLIDGQHRVFAYYEGVEDDPQIALLRVQQNLLVTGIIFPEGIEDPVRQKFEAKLFLEINSTQTSAKSQLKQAIGVVLQPYAAESIAARTLSGMAREGPLSGFIQQYFYDTEKLKTASIVSYGLRPLVKTIGNDSIFKIWTSPTKNTVAEQANLVHLEEYISFCVKTINLFLASIRQVLDKSRWTTDKKQPGRALTTTYINSFLIMLRLLIERGEDLSPGNIKAKLSQMNEFDFTAYHSSQYSRMAEKMVATFFDAPPADSNSQDEKGESGKSTGE